MYIYHYIQSINAYRSSLLSLYVLVDSFCKNPEFMKKCPKI